VVNQSFENCFWEVIVDCTLVVIFLYTDTLYGSENLYRKKSMETEAPAEWWEYKKAMITNQHQLGDLIPIFEFG